MWAFKASWLALVTWHPGTGHFSRCRDALDVPAPSMSSTLAVGALTTPTAAGSSRTELFGSCSQFSRASILLCSSSLSFLGTLPPPSTWSSLSPPSPPSPPSSCRPALLLLLSGDDSSSAHRVRSRTRSCTALSNLALNSCSNSSSLARTRSASSSASLRILCCSSLLSLSCLTTSTCSLGKFM